MISSMESIVAQMLAARLLEARRCKERKGKTGLALCVISVFLFLTGVIYLILSLEGWLAVTNPPHEAQALTALFLFAASLLIGAAASLLPGARKIAPPAGMMNEQELMDLLSDFFREMDLEKPIQDNPKTAALIAALAGFIVAEKFL